MKFEDRFGIQVGFEEAQQRFVHRVHNLFILDFVYDRDQDTRYKIKKAIAFKLGKEYRHNQETVKLISTDFHMNLKAIEAVYGYFSPGSAGYNRYGDEPKLITAIVHRLLSESEIDLGMEWQEGRFTRKGVPLLDEKLVQDSVQWLRTR